MEYLTLEQLRERIGEVRAAFNSLMENRTLAAQKKARQWEFLRSCLECTLVSEQGPWSMNRPQQLAQFKFEVESRLRRFYLRHRGPVDFVFSLVHRRDAVRNRLSIDPEYPHTAGYYLLVRDRRSGGAGPELALAESRAYLEKVVACCIDAEFAAYEALPNIDDGPLLRHVRCGSGAYREVLHILTQLRRRGWALTNPGNPSTKRLLAIDVKELRGGEARVGATEYWYLRWWSTVEQAYCCPFRETSRYTYLLVNTPEGWRVDEKIRPAPRSSKAFW